MHSLFRHSPIRLRRIAGSGFARVLVRTLALLLVLGNIAAATPAGIGMAQHHVDGRPVGTAATVEHHCDDAAMNADMPPMQKTSHGRNCPCCEDNACSCVHATTFLLVSMLPGVSPQFTADVPPAGPANLHEGPFARRLRPPIV